MKASTAKASVVLFLAVGAFAAAHALKPTVHLADLRARVDLQTMFPREFGGWRVDDTQQVQLVSPDTQALLDRIYNQTLSRTYINAGRQRIMLSVAYGGDQSDATRVHRPEVCYPAQGFQMLANSETLLPLDGQSLRVRRLVAKLGGRVEPITYWITVGERVAISGTEQKLAQLAYTTRGVIPDGMLVRVSSIDTDAQAAYRIQQDFIQRLAAAVQRGVRPRVIGAGSV
ncbi:EpsI family protein [Rubrivivax gelatinosus]|nr:EpsI family protein [Rubrivivax gelatinosus]